MKKKEPTMKKLIKRQQKDAKQTVSVFERTHGLPSGSIRKPDGARPNKNKTIKGLLRDYGVR